MDWAEDMMSLGLLLLVLGAGAVVTAVVLLAFINAVDFLENTDDQ